MDKNNLHTTNDELIVKVLSNEADSKEKELLRSWLAASEENKQYFSSFQKTWGISNYQHVKETINLDAEWVVLQNKIRTPQVTNNAFVRRFISIAAAIIIAIGMLTFILKPFSNKTTYFAKSDQLEVVLNDGSVITLSAKSKLTVQKDFSDSKREVSLSGTAFFNVARNEAKPFVVQANHSTIKVLGTSFNIYAPKDALKNVISVSTGMVEVATEADKMVLVKGEEAVVDAEKLLFYKQPTTNENYKAWLTGVLEFNNVSLNEVIQELNTILPKKLVLKSTEVGNCYLTTRFDNQSPESILKVLKTLLPIDVREKSDTFEIWGERCQ